MCPHVTCVSMSRVSLSHVLPCYVVCANVAHVTMSYMSSCHVFPCHVTCVSITRVPTSRHVIYVPASRVSACCVSPCPVSHVPVSHVPMSRLFPLTCVLASRVSPRHILCGPMLHMSPSHACSHMMSHHVCPCHAMSCFCVTCVSVSRVFLCHVCPRLTYVLVSRVPVTCHVCSRATNAHTSRCVIRVFRSRVASHHVCPRGVSLCHACPCVPCPHVTTHVCSLVPIACPRVASVSLRWA